MPSKRISVPVEASTRLYWTLAGGAALHLALALSPLPALLVDRNELSTPITSWTRCKAGTPQKDGPRADLDPQ